jgi:glucose-1-phosphate adenylyltransferase
VGFEEKPAEPRTIPGDPDHCLVNMGVYLYDTEPLVRIVCHDARNSDSSHDFGRDVIPDLVKHDQVFAFPFRERADGRPAYWRDIGTLDSYYEASMDLVARQPKLDLYDPDWPFRAWQAPVPPAKSVHGFTEDGSLPGIVTKSIIGGGAIVSGASVENSILGRKVRVNSYCSVIESILMDGVQVGRYAELHKVIVDKYVSIPEGMIIGRDLEKDRRLFRVTKGGVVVVPKGIGLQDETHQPTVQEV